MAKLKSYLLDDSILNMYVEAKYEVELENGETTMYRYVQGDSNLDMKKQSPRAVAKIIYFGTKIHSTDNATEQKYIENLPYFGRKISIYDPLAKNSEKLAAKKLSINLLKEVAGFDKNRIYEVGYNLFGRDALTYIKNNDVDGLHDQIIEVSGNDPEKVNEIINNKNNADRLFAGFLIASGILEVSVDDRYVTWGHNDSTVYTVPNGVTPLDGLVDFFQTREGSEIKKEASLKLESKAVAKPKGRPAKVVEETDEEK